MKSFLLSLCMLTLSVLFVGCSSKSEHGDLREYISQTKSRPSGNIEPLPSFRPFEAFIYGSAAKRSPFERPIDVKRRVFAQASVGVSPDFNRAKEYLEGVDLNSLKMMGHIKKGGALWALVTDEFGNIHRVTTGSYMGKNHGRIVETTEAKLELIEIVSDGLDGWVERPRILAIVEKE